MIRMAVLVVVGFLIGVGSATAYVVTREEPKPLTAYLTGPDSVPAAPDSLAPADSAAVAVQDSLAPLAPPLPALAAPVPPVPDSAGQAVVATVAPDSATVTPTVARTPLDRERVTRMFAAMKPQEAARVLEQMGDDEVRVLLATLSDRKAGAILSSLPPQRAAAISRPSLQTKE